MPADHRVTSGPQRLRGRIGPLQYLALGFGTMIGSAWVILLGDWLGKAGPGGAVLGFLAGALVMLPVGACYAELMARVPEAGSEFIYALRIYGRWVAFVVGWFMILYYVSVTVFEGLALAWLVEILIPAVGATPLYSAWGAQVTHEVVAVGLLGTAAIAALNYRGSRAAVFSHTLLTYAFLAAALVIFVVLLAHGQAANLEPLFAGAPGRHWLLGSGAIFAFCAYALNGFQAIPQAIEERSSHLGLHTIARLIVGAILAAALFYCLVVIAASAIVPWRRLVTAPLPMVAAVAALPHGQAFVTGLLIATAASLLKAWNGVFMMAVRLVLAMGRAGYGPAVLARLHPRYGSPAAAILTIALLNMSGIFLGRGAIAPITDMCAMVLTSTYLLCCVTVLRLRRAAPGADNVRLPAGLLWVGIIGSAAMAVLAFASPWWQQSGIPLEWRLLLPWSVTGVVVSRFVVPARPGERVLRRP